MLPTDRRVLLVMCLFSWKNLVVLCLKNEIFINLSVILIEETSFYHIQIVLKCLSEILVRYRLCRSTNLLESLKTSPYRSKQH